MRILSGAGTWNRCRKATDARGRPDHPDRPADDPRRVDRAPFAAVLAARGVVSEHEVLVRAEIGRLAHAGGAARRVTEIAQDGERAEFEGTALTAETDARSVGPPFLEVISLLEAVLGVPDADRRVRSRDLEGEVVVDIRTAEMRPDSELERDFLRSERLVGARGGESRDLRDRSARLRRFEGESEEVALLGEFEQESAVRLSEEHVALDHRVVHVVLAAHERSVGREVAVRQRSVHGLEAVVRAGLHLSRIEVPPAVVLLPQSLLAGRSDERTVRARESAA